MKGKPGKSADTRTSFTIHLEPREALLVKAAAARASTTPHDLARDLLLRRASDDAPVLACLAQLIAIHRRLENACLLDSELRIDIVGAVRELTRTARAEIAG